MSDVLIAIVNKQIFEKYVVEDKIISNSYRNNSHIGCFNEDDIA